MSAQGARERPTIAITAGEPAGIGPELVAMLAARNREHAFAARLVVIGDRELLARRAARIGAAAHYADYDIASFGAPAGAVEVWHQPVAAPVRPGHPDPTNAHSVRAMLVHAADACATGAFAALVTAPVQKSVMQDAGIAFSGHTEFFAERTHTPRVVMLLVGGARRCASRSSPRTCRSQPSPPPSRATRSRGRSRSSPPGLPHSSRFLRRRSPYAD